jgi:hypothetical protein
MKFFRIELSEIMRFRLFDKWIWGVTVRFAEYREQRGKLVFARWQCMAFHLKALQNSRTIDKILIRNLSMSKPSYIHRRKVLNSPIRAPFEALEICCFLSR